MSTNPPTDGQQTSQQVEDITAWFGPKTPPSCPGVPFELLVDLYESEQPDVVDKNKLTNRPRLDFNQITALSVQNIKEWHQLIKTDHRKYFIYELVQTVLLSSIPWAILDKNMHIILSYARNVESKMYELANSRSEYYCFLANKNHEIRKRIEGIIRQQKKRQQKWQQFRMQQKEQ